MAGKTLTIVLAADISRLSRGLKSAQGDLDYFNGKLGSVGSSLSSALVPGLLGAAAAAGTLAIAMGVEGVKSAIAEEAAQAKLAKTLSNLGFASANDQVTKFIETQMRATGVADDLLRPAYDRLIRSTQDIGKANSALSLSMDISAGTGKSLEAVTNALGKAYDGNYGALGKLGTGIDKATLASGNMDLITSKLAQTFGGQAATQANTFAGKLQQLVTAGSELTEAFGTGVVDAFQNATDGGTDLSASIYKMQGSAKALGTTVGDTAAKFLILSGNVATLWTQFSTWSDNNPLTRNLFTLVNHLNPVTWAFDLANKAAEIWNQTQNATNTQSGATGAALQRQATVLELYGNTVAANTPTTIKNTAAIKINTDALDAQNESLDKSLNKLRNQSDALKNANQAYTDYTKNLSGQIFSKIDLVKQFADAVAAGEDPAAALGRIFEQQDWYTNILAALKNGGATQAVIDAVSAGGIDGGAQLGQSVLDLGLIPYLNENLYRLENTADSLAKKMVPAFILAGQQQAIENLDAMSKEVLESGAKLKQIGKNIGKPISNQITKEITDALKQAWIDIDAAKSAAEAAAVAAGANRRVVVSDQQAIQQLNQILANGNARAGYQESVVIA